MKHATTLRLLGMVIVVVLVLVVIVLHLSGAETLVQSTTELILIIVSVAGTIAFQLMIWPERFLTPAKETPEVEAKPGTLGMVLNDRAITQLTKMARRGYKDTLKLNLDLIGQELEGGRIPPKFISWDETEPELRKGLITSKPEYDALDDFAKSLTQCPRRDEPNFDVMSNLCKTHYERLKRLGLAS